MNVVRRTVPQESNNLAGPALGQRFKAKGCAAVGGEDPRQMIADRYPAGLISDDELEALLGRPKS
jgi:hypothetical protein